MVEILRGYDELANLLFDTSEAELVQGGVRLRETLHELKRVEVALQQSESRHAFLLRLGDALRRLVNPMAMQGEASRLLGERLMTDRAYYAEIDVEQGCIVVERNFVRAGVSSRVGRYSVSDFNWIGPTFRMGGPVVVADTQTSPLIPDAVRSAVGVGAFVAAPLMRNGRLVAALLVNDLSPRDWTPDEVGYRQGNRGAELGGHRTCARRGAVAASQCPKRRVPGDAGARARKSAGTDTNQP